MMTAAKVESRLGSIVPPSPDTIILETWLPELFAGFDITLVMHFVDRLRKDGGFVTAQDLLDALYRKQLTQEFMRDVAGFKLGHYNRLLNGLTALLEA
jgi:hypothetical protein